LRSFNKINSPITVIIKISLTRIASGSKDYSIKVFDLLTGQCLKIIEGNLNFAIYLRKINKTQIIRIGSNGSIMLWDFNKPKCLNSFDTNLDYIISVAKLSHSKIIITYNITIDT